MEVWLLARFFAKQFGRRKIILRRSNLRRSRHQPHLAVDHHGSAELEELGCEPQDGGL